VSGCVVLSVCYECRTQFFESAVVESSAIGGATRQPDKQLVPTRSAHYDGSKILAEECYKIVHAFKQQKN